MYILVCPQPAHVSERVYHLVPYQNMVFDKLGARVAPVPVRDLQMYAVFQVQIYRAAASPSSVACRPDVVGACRIRELSAIVVERISDFKRSRMVIADELPDQVSSRAHAFAGARMICQRPSSDAILDVAD